MPTPLPDYYAILDLDPDATQDEIKKRYRELARKYHPDVNPSPDAAQKIKTVNEAHRVLGDPDRRSMYDAERVLNGPPPKVRTQTRTAPAEPRTPPRSFPQKQRQTPGPNSPPSRDQKSGPRVEFNGFGRVQTENQRKESARKPVPQGPSAQELAAAAYRLVSEAQIAFLTRNYSDADRLAREALAKDRTTSGAHEVLGDIFAVRGDTDAAVKAYSYAIQFNPHGYSVQGKLDRLIGKSPYAAGGPVKSARKAKSAVRPFGSRMSREAIMGGISFTLFIGACAVLAEYAQNAGVAVGGAIPWITSLSPNLMIALALEGIIGGVLLAFYGKLRPISQELSAGSELPGNRKAPLLVILTLFSIVWFYASLLVYIGVAVGKNRFSPSAVRVYGLVMALTALFTAMAAAGDRGSWLETAAFAGNILFPGALFGWFLGDCVRLRT